MQLGLRREIGALRDELSEYRAFHRAFTESLQKAFTPEIRPPAQAARPLPVDLTFDIVGARIKHGEKLLTLDELPGAFPDGFFHGLEGASIRTPSGLDQETARPLIDGLMRFLHLNGINDITFEPLEG